MTVVDGAAESGAIALADDRSAEAAVRRALPGWAADRAAVHSDGGRVEVIVNAPAIVPGLGGRIELSSAAAVATS